MFGKKKHVDIQFYTDVGETITDLGRHRGGDKVRTTKNIIAEQVRTTKNLLFMTKIYFFDQNLLFFDQNLLFRLKEN
jgi:hypothetical protein